MDPAIITKIDKVNRNNETADTYTERMTDLLRGPFMGASYSDGQRIKGIKLIIRNKDEEFWPGTRTDFEIDRDQILFRNEFNRLARKTQVFTGPSVAYRNRLTHTLDVVQLSRSIAQTHSLNTDLVEAIALGHDIGHTPFGHTGEEALNLCLFEYFIRHSISKFLSKYESESHPMPHIGGLTKTNNVNDSQHIDQAIWLLINKIAKPTRQWTNFKLFPIALVLNIITLDLFDVLREKHILFEVDKSRCRFNKPLTWQSESLLDNQKVLEKQFWVQDDSISIFSHNVHSLRILLCDPDKRHGDITYQTAYGILTHTYRGKLSKPFKIEVPEQGESFISSTHKTKEAFVVALSDDICFINSDIRDAENAGIYKFDSVSKTYKEHYRNLGTNISLNDFPQSSDLLQRCEANFDFTEGNTNHTLLNSIDKVQIDIGKNVHSKLITRQDSARNVIRQLFWFFCKSHDPKLLRSVETSALKIYKKFRNKRSDFRQDEVRIVTDYIASLTDDEAVSIHSALFAPQINSWERYFANIEEDS